MKLHDDLEFMKFQCKHWEGLYGFNERTKNVIGVHYPFMLLNKHGIIFNKFNSNELKDDEKLLIKKAIKRINIPIEKTTNFILRFLSSVRIVHSERSKKLKLFHGLFYDRNNDSCTELTFTVINNKVCDVFNNIFGLVPENYIYFGIEIPKDILKKAIINKGLSVEVDNPNYELKPNSTTIFIKALDDLVKYYKIKDGQDN